MREHSLAIDRYLDFVIRRKWLFIIPMAVAGLAILAAWAFAPQVQQKEYQARATMRLTLSGGVGGVPRLDKDEIARITNSSFHLAENRTTLSQIAEELNLDASAGSLRSRISFRSLPDSEFIEVSARASSPEEARELANAAALAWQRVNAEFYNTANRPELANSFSFVEPATGLPGATPVQSDWPGRIMIALALGLAAGLGLALVSEYTDRTLNSVGDVSQAASVPILSSLPLLKHSPFQRRSLGAAQNELDARQMGEMRLLTFKLARMAREQGLRSILFTGIWPKAGTSSVAVGAASGLAADEFDVVLVDGNLNSPSLYRVFDAPKGQPGLTDVLASTASGDDFRVAIDKAAIDSDRPGLGVLTSGTPMPDSWATLGSAEMRRLVELHNRHSDTNYEDNPSLLVIDGPALFDSADALALASVVSGVVIVCAEGRTTSDDLQRSLSQLESVGAQVLGLIYNKAKAASNLPHSAPNLIVSGTEQPGFVRASFSSDELRR